ncbi:hypothetical protein ACIP6Q_39170 [Streptomyces bobili]|uniref:hypothetical protein n=1 Tax=Streptomyces bobili TaxID=67280 RepID=UPI0038097532
MSQPSADARAVVRALDALTTQVRRVADAPSSGTCDASSLGAFDRHLGPCLLRANHDGPVHRGPEGETWATIVRAADDAPTTTADDGPCPQHPYAPTFNGICGGCTQYPADFPARRPPMDPVHILGIDPSTPEGVAVQQAPAAGEDQTLRWARRESLLVLLTRIQHGRILTEDEARTLRHHIETEMRDADTAHERARKAERAVDLLADSHRRADQAEELLRVAHETSNKSEAERARAAQRAERLAAVLREVLALFAPTLMNGKYAFYQATDHPIAPHDYQRWHAALDGTEQPTTEEQS